MSDLCWQFFLINRKIVIIFPSERLLLDQHQAFIATIPKRLIIRNMRLLSTEIPAKHPSDEFDALLASIRDKFHKFQIIKEKNNKILKIISDMEEKSSGNYVFDANYIRKCISEIESGLGETIECLIQLGGSKYERLKECYHHINEKLLSIISGNTSLHEDNYTIPLSDLSRDHAYRVGSKNAQLGELTRLGLPVPDGFAISAWSYKHFMASNDLQERITREIDCVDISSYEDIQSVSREIRSIVASSPVPPDLTFQIETSLSELEERIGIQRLSLRSSAIAEDTQYSFAGQYESFLNIKGTDLVRCYRDVLASKFTPKAIYYLLSHSFNEAELSMGVCCMGMVNAAASGVIYTRDPVNPEGDDIIISSIYGLGKYIGDGSLIPDVIKVARSDCSVSESVPGIKPVKLELDPAGGTIEKSVNNREQNLLSLNEKQAGILAEYAMKIENHYKIPMDIEWAIDKDGRSFILQARPLKVLTSRRERPHLDLSELTRTCKGTATICPGAGGGPVFHVSTAVDLQNVPDGSVLIAEHPFPGLITVLSKVNALLTEVGSVASHLATITREYRIPALVVQSGLTELADGRIVTVDATGMNIYEGLHSFLVRARALEQDEFDEMDIYKLLDDVLTYISPLNLIHPESPDFTPENCATFHDITRYTHQKAMFEMFHCAKDLDKKDRLNVRLQTDIPIRINLIYIDRSSSEYIHKKRIKEEDLESEPMQAIWVGVREQGWPSHSPPKNSGRFISAIRSHSLSGRESGFSENSFAILSKEYMVLSLRLGYHFTTIESMCTDVISKNYIRFQNKGGGASLERRIRRVKLLEEVLGRLGFEHSSQGDFVDSHLSYQNKDTIIENLRLLGRLTMLTKQLDMALSNDSVADWYMHDILRILEIGDVAVK